MTDNTNTDLPLRAAFEAWAVKLDPPYKLEKGQHPFIYVWSSTACAWNAFEAGAAHAVAQVKAREITDAEIDVLRKDAERLDWLEKYVVNVRVPLRYGSRDIFWASPEQDDPAFHPGPSDIRAKIDDAITLANGRG